MKYFKRTRRLRGESSDSQGRGPAVNGKISGLCAQDSPGWSHRGSSLQPMGAASGQEAPIHRVVAWRGMYSRLNFKGVSDSACEVHSDLKRRDQELCQHDSGPEEDWLACLGNAILKDFCLRDT